MFASKPGRVVLAGAALIAQAGPAHAAEALPLAEAVLRQVTATGLGSPATPQWPQADGLAAVRATAGIDPMRSAGDFQASMNSVRSPAGSEVPANSQGATNLTLAVTLNGTPFLRLRPAVGRAAQAVSTPSSAAPMLCRQEGEVRWKAG